MPAPAPQPSSASASPLAPGRVQSTEERELPTIRISLAADEVVKRLDEASRRGKMPGFHRGSNAGPLFTVTDFGTPFESVLEARQESTPTGTDLAFTVRMKPRMAWLYGIVLVATVWPGVWVTDSMLKTYFPGTNLYTWWWYLPLTVPFVPLGLWSAVRKSRVSGLAEGREIIRKVRGVLGA